MSDDNKEKTPDAAAPPVQPTIDVNAEREAARKAERERVADITALGRQFNMADLVDEAIGAGTEVDAFRAQILERMGTIRPVETPGELGLTEREADQFSFVRLINALANPRERSFQDRAAFELEVCGQYGEQARREVRGALIPPDVLLRDLSAGTDAAGGYTVDTNLLAASFIELLRNRMVVQNAGATIMSGLAGDVAIPKQSGGATAYWVAEAGAPTESQQTLAQLQLTPKTVAAYTDFTRKLMLQGSIDVEAFVRGDLAKVLALAVDLACLHGTGADNQPSGIAVTSGIGSVAGGTNGLAPAWSHIVSLETEVSQDNADVGALGYITNAKVRGKLKQVFTNATYGDIAVWQDGAQPGVGMVNGYPAYVTNQCSSTLTKGSASGVCSAIFYGNWADLIIGFWSGIDLLVDPYSLSTSAGIRVTAFQDCDLGVRHAESFAAMLDALTT